MRGCILRGVKKKHASLSAEGSIRVNIHFFQHLPFEDSAGILDWAKTRGHETARTLFSEPYRLPPLANVDWLIILGGFMNACQHNEYPWLTEEKAFLREAAGAGKLVLGVCLGAQIIADAFGGRVYRNPEPEIGWHPVELTDAGRRSRIFGGLPPRFTAFHWHGDTFDLPPGAVHTVRSAVCPNQAFEYADGRVVGLQFHLETTDASMEKLIGNCADELVSGRPYIQSAADMRAGSGLLPGLNRMMTVFLDRMAEGYHRQP